MLTVDLIWLAVGAIAAGLVRGFAGFGTGMVYLPIAGQVLGPFEAITTMVLMDCFGPLPNVPRALRDGRPRDVLRLSLALVVTLPFGVALLSYASPEVFRYGLSAVSVTLLICLMAGLRYRGKLTPAVLYFTGGLSGFLCGLVGLAGPPVILLYVASTSVASAIRANTLLFLLVSDIVLMAAMWIFGHLITDAILVGLFLTIPYLLANIVGAAIFRPEYEKLYRSVAYALIAASAFASMPFFD